MGVILFQIMSGSKPFQNRRDIETNVSSALDRAFREHHDLWHTRVSASLKGLLKRLLQINAKKRPTCDDVLRLDPWFQVQKEKGRFKKNEDEKCLERNVYVRRDKASIIPNFVTYFSFHSLFRSCYSSSLLYFTGTTQFA